MQGSNFLGACICLAFSLGKALELVVELSLVDQAGLELRDLPASAS